MEILDGPRFAETDILTVEGWLAHPASRQFARHMLACEESVRDISAASARQDCANARQATVHGIAEAWKRGVAEFAHVPMCPMPKHIVVGNFGGVRLIVYSDDPALVRLVCHAGCERVDPAIVESMIRRARDTEGACVVVYYSMPLMRAVWDAHWEARIMHPDATRGGVSDGSCVVAVDKGSMRQVPHTTSIAADAVVVASMTDALVKSYETIDLDAVHKESTTQREVAGTRDASVAASTEKRLKDMLHQTLMEHRCVVEVHRNADAMSRAHVATLVREVTQLEEEKVASTDARRAIDAAAATLRSQIASSELLFSEERDELLRTVVDLRASSGAQARKQHALESQLGVVKRELESTRAALAVARKAAREAARPPRLPSRRDAACSTDTLQDADIRAQRARVEVLEAELVAERAKIHAPAPNASIGVNTEPPMDPAELIELRESFAKLYAEHEQLQQDASRLRLAAAPSAAAHSLAAAADVMRGAVERSIVEMQKLLHTLPCKGAGMHAPSDYSHAHAHVRAPHVHTRIQHYAQEYSTYIPPPTAMYANQW